MQSAEHSGTRTALASTVDRLIAQYLADQSPDPLLLRQTARRVNALPVHLDMGGWFGVRPNGEVISVDWERDDDVRVEECPRVRNLAFHQGSKKYPALRQFVPARPADAVECPHCKGHGDLPAPLDRVVCYCGGVGWLPPGVPVYYARHQEGGGAAP